MEGLLDEEFCKNVEVVTSNVFLERVKMHEVDVLVQKTSKGEKINQKETNDVAVILHKGEEDMKQKEKFLKKQNCQSIAKFYIKIAQLYSAIVKTVDPQFDVYDETTMERKDIFDVYGINNDSDVSKSKIRELETDNIEVYNGFCYQRIRSLIQLLPKYKEIQEEQIGGNPNNFFESKPFFAEEKENKDEKQNDIQEGMTNQQVEPQPIVEPTVEPTS